MIRESGSRFSETIMHKQGKLDHDPILFDRIMI